MKEDSEKNQKNKLNTKTNHFSVHYLKNSVSFFILIVPYQGEKFIPMSVAISGSPYTEAIQKCQCCSSNICSGCVVIYFRKKQY